MALHRRLLAWEEVLDLSEERTEDGSGLEHHYDVEVLTHPPDPLTNASNVDSGWTCLLPSFPVVLSWRPGCRGRADEGARLNIPHDRWSGSVPASELVQYPGVSGVLWSSKAPNDARTWIGNVWAQDKFIQERSCTYILESTNCIRDLPVVWLDVQEWTCPALTLGS